MALNRLKSLREARRLSLVELAAKVGTTGQQISHLELGKRHLTVEWLERLASALNCHPWAIVSETNPRESELLELFRAMSPTEQDALLADTLARLPKRREPQAGS